MTDHEIATMQLMSKSELLSLAQRLHAELVALIQQDLVTSYGLAKFFHISERNLRQVLATSPDFPPPAHRLGKKFFWRMSSVIEWIQSRD
ncbi:hypothetical protein C9940_00635 [Pseudidiomarina aestuarii]|uniref:DNA-binding protein n=1 Tax=Pseudidiomarina aestuarii TaxID=624146 RepID=A0A2T4CZ92_9GAMM|nr:hypothetical protein C9940_00635 [Pseudidiomarina aestuarii]